MGEIRTYEGSHVFVFDSIDNPTKLVLVYNPHIGHIATPGFGRRKEMSFEDALKNYTEEQTGLIIDDLELLSEWNNNGEPFREPNNVLQYIKVRNYLARNVKPDGIEDRIEQYNKTDNGMLYKPSFVEIAGISNIHNLAEEIPELLRTHFDIEI